jgi:hypothetical protein
MTVLWILLLIVLIVAIVAVGVAVLSKRRRAGGVVAVKRKGSP